MGTNLSIKRPYEAGMRIVHNEKDKSVSITFRGKVIVLNGPYETAAQAIKAGEAYCGSLGWADAPSATAGKSMLRRSKPW
jgi:hypothetical protein